MDHADTGTKMKPENLGPHDFGPYVSAYFEHAISNYLLAHPADTPNISRLNTLDGDTQMSYYVGMSRFASLFAMKLNEQMTDLQVIGTSSEGPFGILEQVASELALRSSIFPPNTILGITHTPGGGVRISEPTLDEQGNVIEETIWSYVPQQLVKNSDAEATDNVQPESSPIAGSSDQGRNIGTIILKKLRQIKELFND